MARLIADASKMTDIQKELNLTVDEGDMSFGNIVNAISVMQTSLGIAGTTAKEATDTISGSLSSAKSAFDNFLSGTGSIDDVVETFTTAGNNIMKAIVELAPKIVDGIVQMINQFIPMLPTLIETLLPTIIDGIVSLINGIINALPQLISTLATMLPTIIQTLSDNFLTILDSIADMLPDIIPIIVDAIIKILDVFNQNFDKFLMVGIKIILAIIEGLIKSIPNILKNLPTIIMAIINFFTAAKLVSAGRTLLTGLGEGLIKGIPQLVAKPKQILKYVINAFKENGLGAFKNIGLDIVKGIGKGITSGVSWIKNVITGFVGNVTGFLKKLFKIHSPSKLMSQEIGQWLPKGIAVGIEANTDSVTKAMDNINSDILDSSVFDLSPNVVANTGMNFSPVVNTTVVVNNETDPLGQLVNNVKTFSNGAKNDYNYGM